jgi:hypothetical protein
LESGPRPGCVLRLRYLAASGLARHARPPGGGKRFLRLLVVSARGQAGEVMMQSRLRCLTGGVGVNRGGMSAADLGIAEDEARLAGPGLKFRPAVVPAAVVQPQAPRRLEINLDPARPAKRPAGERLAPPRTANGASRAA